MEPLEQETMAASALLQSGFPFCPFPEDQLKDLPTDSVLEWVEEKLDAGQLFVVRSFDRLDTRALYCSPERTSSIFYPWNVCLVSCICETELTW